MGYPKISWVKSIKRNDGREWAYYDNDNDEFFLNFSDKHAKRIMNIEPGEIILLFQRVDRMVGVKKRTYLTHLVTPLDMVNTLQNVTHRFHNGIKVGVIARMDRNNQIFSTPKILNFHGVRSGGVFEPKWLNENYTAEEIQDIIWDLFAKKTSIDLAKTKNIPGVDFWDYEAWEGDSKVVGPHLRKERDRELIRQAKEKALADGNGRILCECCGFDFSAFYGEHGRNFIECHHRDPIGLGGIRKSKIDDLAMVCSNCHRMLHRRIPGKIDYYTVESLGEFLGQRKNIIS